MGRLGALVGLGGKQGSATSYVLEERAPPLFQLRRLRWLSENETSWPERPFSCSLMMTADEGRLSRSNTHEKELHKLAVGPSSASAADGSAAAAAPHGEVLESLRADHPDLALMMECFSERLPAEAFDTIQEIIRQVSIQHACDSPHSHLHTPSLSRLCLALCAAGALARGAADTAPVSGAGRVRRRAGEPAECLHGWQAETRGARVAVARHAASRRRHPEGAQGA